MFGSSTASSNLPSHSFAKVLLSLGVPISAHAFNADKSEVAVCPCSNETHIYSLKQSGASAPVLLHVLTGHDKLVTGIDWAPVSNRIVTCSQDRNAYVWTYDSAAKKWNPSLVLLRINRSATFVRWAPSEKKFAVASGARCISVCSFEADNDWWVSRHLRESIRGTVLTLAWHPNSVLLAAGGVDRRLRVFSAFIKNVDTREQAPPGPWGDKFPFNQICADIDVGSWVHAIDFSPGDGSSLAFSTHDSSIYVYTPSAGAAAPILPVQIALPVLPVLSLVFTTPDEIITAGHDNTPLIIRRNSAGKWECFGSPELPSGGGGASAVKSTPSSIRSQGGMGGGSGPGGSAAGSNCLAVDTMNFASHAASVPPPIGCIHGASIRTLRLHSKVEFSTSGTDGKLVMWDALSFKLGSALKI